MLGVRNWPQEGYFWEELQAPVDWRKGWLEIALLNKQQFFYFRDAETKQRTLLDLRDNKMSGGVYIGFTVRAESRDQTAIGSFSDVEFNEKQMYVNRALETNYGYTPNKPIQVTLTSYASMGDKAVITERIPEGWTIAEEHADVEIDGQSLIWKLVQDASKASRTYSITPPAGADKKVEIIGDVDGLIAAPPTPLWPIIDPKPGTMVYCEKNEGYPYWLYLPPDYQSNKSYPLLVYLHGSTCIASKSVIFNLLSDEQNRERLPELFQFVALFPQAPISTRLWDEGLIINTMNEVMAIANIDADRMYVTGVSMGGIGVFFVTRHSPEYFAAGVCVAGGDINTEPIKGVPLRAYHGLLDRIVNGPRVITFFQEYIKNGGDLEFFIDDDQGHTDGYSYMKDDLCNINYNNPDLYRWLLKHSKKLK